MKLNEKELNELPIGTKITLETKHTLTKCVDFYIDKDGWLLVDQMARMPIIKIEIPTYIEYIPPQPVLDEKEKEYLGYVIRPFRKYIYGIVKRECGGCYYITLFNSRGYNIDLPFFEKGKMYNCMELDREYSLEELEL